MKKCLFFLSLLIFALLGCGGTATATIPATITSTYMPTRLPNIPTVTISVPTDTPTTTSTPTVTVNPTILAASTLYQQTREVRDVKLQATQQAMESFRKIFKGMCDNASFQTWLSPDGNWLTQDCVAGRFQVIKKNAPTIWTVDYKQVFEYMEQSGEIFPVYWTKDGGYLYFSRRDCCADNDTMSNGNMLYRMNLETGEWKMIIGGYFNYYSFSPTSRRLLYILNDQASTGNPLVLHVMDITSGSEVKFDFPGFEQAGNVIWKEDGLQFVMVAKTGNRFDGYERFSIVVVDLKKNTPKVVIADSKVKLRIAQWSDDNVLTFEKQDYYDIAEQSYYDLNSQQWITPTPSQ